MSKLRTEWLIESMENIANGGMVHVDSFELWRAKRDEKVREDRARTAALKARAQETRAEAREQRALEAAERDEARARIEALRAMSAATVGPPRPPSSPATYVVHGYDNLFPSSPNALIYAGPDESVARMAAIARSRRQGSNGERAHGLRKYARTRMTVVHNGSQIGTYIDY